MAQCNTGGNDYERSLEVSTQSAAPQRHMRAVSARLQPADAANAEGRLLSTSKPSPVTGVRAVRFCSRPSNGHDQVSE